MLRNPYRGLILEVPHTSQWASRPQEVANAVLQGGTAKKARRVLAAPKSQLMLLSPSESLVRLDDDWRVLILEEKTVYVYAPRAGIGINAARRLVAKAHIVGMTLPWPDEHEKINDMGQDIPPAIRRHLHY